MTGQVEAFCRGGASWVQLRLKETSREEFLRIAHECRRITEEHGSGLILDDRVDMVEKVGADGVHLGEQDLPPRKARAVLGAKAIIGGTADRFERIEEIAGDVDYIGCGPYRFTSSKKALSPVLGLEGYRRILGTMKAEGIHTPILAIGGIRKEDVPPLMEEGVYGVALSAAITEAEDPANETASFLSLLKG